MHNDIWHMYLQSTLISNTDISKYLLTSEFYLHYNSFYLKEHFLQPENLLQEVSAVGWLRYLELTVKYYVNDKNEKKEKKQKKIITMKKI